MQFQYNSDYPGLSPETGQPIQAEAREPVEFPPAQPIPCARITTRIFHPARNQVATVQNVLVRTPATMNTSSRRHSATNNKNNNNNNHGGAGGDAMSQDGSLSSSSSSDDLSSISAESMAMDDDNPIGGLGGGGPAAAAVGVAGPLHEQFEQEEDRAYWVQRTIREAIYGRVLFAVILKKRIPSPAANDSAEWEVTDRHCAVKEMSWQHIRKERDRLAEDPIKEVASMQYLRRWHVQHATTTTTTTTTQQQHPNNSSSKPHLIDGVAESFRAIMETNIMMPLDLLTDDRNLYSIMPYCDGGELFERLDLNERFSEEEARYWMHQVLNGIENLQKTGICHRDMSLENLLVHETGALIIDMGMCLRVPIEEEDITYPPASATATLATTTAGLTASMQNMTMNGGIASAQQAPPELTQRPPAAVVSPALKGGAASTSHNPCPNARTNRRYLLKPQGTCGKWIYMSPEIFKNQEAFDGYAVDLWAAGVILFLMVTGFPPWERACQTDERFKYMTAGYLVQMLTEWNLGISSDAMDLLQRMLFLDPKDRLSLDQVRAHPWMVNGPQAAPPRLSGMLE